MRLINDTTCRENLGALQYLGRGDKSQQPTLAAPNSVPDPYMGQGSHPDIVQRVWDELGANFPKRCRCLVYGTPVLVHDRTGIIIAICNGTQYNLRLKGDDYFAAIAKGAKTRTRWSTGEEMDCVVELGPDWVFGGWYKEEIQWCLNSYEALR